MEQSNQLIYEGPMKTDVSLSNTLYHSGDSPKDIFEVNFNMKLLIAFNNAWYPSGLLVAMHNFEISSGR